MENEGTRFIKEHERELAALADRLRVASKMPDQTGNAASLAEAIGAVVQGLLGDPRAYGTGAPHSLQTFGDRFLGDQSAVSDERPNTRFQALRRLAIPALRISLEKTLRSGVVSDQHDIPILRASKDDWFQLEPTFALITLKTIVLEDLVKKTEELHVIDDRVNKVRVLIDEWDQKIGEYDKRAETLIENFNFGGFAKAFSSMLADVNKSKRWSLRLLWIVALCAFGPPLGLAGFALFVPEKIPGFLSDPHQRFLIAGPALLTYEILCVYFFRVVLRTFQSASAQASQLNLRLAACAFIQQYAKFAGSQKPETLEKFEALIFSGLAIEPGKVPSTFDGIDQIVTAFRGAKGE